MSIYLNIFTKYLCIKSIQSCILYWEYNFSFDFVVENVLTLIHFCLFQLSRKLFRRLLPIWEPMLRWRTKMPKWRILSCTRVRRPGSYFQVRMPNRLYCFFLWNRGKNECTLYNHYIYRSISKCILSLYKTNLFSYIFRRKKKTHVLLPPIHVPMERLVS